MQVNHFGVFIHHDDLIHLRHFFKGTKMMEGIDCSQSLVYSPAQRPMANYPLLLLGSCRQVDTPFKLCLILVIYLKESNTLISVEHLVSFIYRVHIANNVIG